MVQDLIYEYKEKSGFDVAQDVLVTMVNCLVLKEGRHVVGEACDQVSTDFVVEKFWYKNLTLRGMMNLDRKFCLPGYPGGRHPEDVLELIMCAQKTSIF